MSGLVTEESRWRQMTSLVDHFMHFYMYFIFSFRNVSVTEVLTALTLQRWAKEDKFEVK